MSRFDEYAVYNFPDWDGEGANPITPNTIDSANIIQKLLDSEPDIAPGADGSLAWEWRFTDDDAILFIDVIEDVATIYFRKGRLKSVLLKEELNEK